MDPRTGPGSGYLPKFHGFAATLVFTLKRGLLSNNITIYITIFNHEIDAARYFICYNKIFCGDFFSRNIIVSCDILNKGLIVNPTGNRLE